MTSISFLCAGIIIGVIIGFITGSYGIIKYSNRFTQTIWFEVDPEFVINVSDLLKHINGLRRYELPMCLEMTIKQELEYRPENVRFEKTIPISFWKNNNDETSYTYLKYFTDIVENAGFRIVNKGVI